jgi:hypothetical protein
MLISCLQNHPITLVLFLTSSLPLSYSQQERILRPGITDITPPPPPEDITNPGGPDSGAGPELHPVDSDFIKDLELIFETTPTCHTYKMSHVEENYDTSQVGSIRLNWGMHALQWKGYNHIAEYPGSGTFDADLANDLDPPGYASGTDGGLDGPYPMTVNNVSCRGSDRLDQLEQASSEIFKINGNPTDPTGSWATCVQDEPDPLSGAILGAMNMFYWNTPTYLDLKDPAMCINCDELYEDWSAGVGVMKQVTLCAEGSEPPHVACNWEDNSGAEVGSCEATLVLESVLCGLFKSGYPDGTEDFYFEDDALFTPSRWESAYSLVATAPLNLNQLVFDPPAGTDVEALQERARLTATKVLDPSKLARMIESVKGSSVRGTTARPGGKK